MADKPVLFSTPMIKALIAECKKPGTGKTQTRRVLSGVTPDTPGRWRFGRKFSSIVYDSDVALRLRGHESEYCPYVVGDRLWVRETWADDEQFGGVLYRADNPDADPIGNGWRPSIFMPRKHSRITLSITDVRVQRLQEISDSDAWAEGVTLESLSRYEGQGVHLFRDLWDSINGKKPGRGWDDNPWIVAVSFRPELRNIDEPVREIAA